jgi:hypothetical protein
MPPSTFDDAKATVEFAILHQLIGNVPSELNEHLQRISKVAASAVEESSTAWAFELVASASKP